MIKPGMFKSLVQIAQKQLETNRPLRDINIPVTGTQNQKNYYRRQLSEYREFNRSMFILGRLTEDEFIETLKLEYVVEKSIDNFILKGV